MINKKSLKQIFLTLAIISLVSCSKNEKFQEAKKWACNNLFHCISNFDLLERDEQGYDIDLSGANKHTANFSKIINSQIKTSTLPGFRGDIVGEPLIENNRLYILNSRGSVYAYNFKTDNHGQIEFNLDWEIDLLYNRFINSELSGGGIVKNNNKLYITNGTELIYIVDLNSHELVTTWSFSNIIKTPVIFNEGKIYVKTIDNSILILEKEQGNILARTNLINYTLNFTSNYPVRFHGDNLIEISHSGKVIVYNKDSLENKYEIDLSRYLGVIDPEEFSLLGLLNEPIISDNKLYITSKNDGIICVDLEDRKILWHRNLPDFQRLIAKGNSIFAATIGKQIVAMEAQDGTIAWVSNLFDASKRPSEAKRTTNYRYLELYGDKLVAVSDDSSIFLVDAYSGKLDKRRFLKYTSNYNKILTALNFYDAEANKTNFLVFFGDGKYVSFKNPS
jgi:outer membrane protein assembly factor BamB